MFDFGDRFSMEDGTQMGDLKELSIKNSS
jgi:hypothetical protein